MALELASLLIAVLPVLVLYALFRRADAARPEPTRLLLKTMGLGFVSCIPAMALELAQKRLLGDAALAGGRFLDAFLVAGLTEEATKLLVVLVFVYRRAAFDEVLDGVIYTGAVSLGFGLFENLVYVNGALVCALARIPLACPDENLDGNITLGLVRALTAVPMHALASGLMGYFVGRARFVHVTRSHTLLDDLHLLPFPILHSVPRLAWCLTGLGAAVAVHGTYDWAVYSAGSSRLVLLELPLLLTLAAFVLARLVRHARALDTALAGPGHRHSLLLAFFGDRGADAPTLHSPRTQRKPTS